MDIVLRQWLIFSCKRDIVCHHSLANEYCMGAMANIPLQMCFVLKTVTNILLQMDIVPKQWLIFPCKRDIVCHHSLANEFCMGAMANIRLQMCIVLRNNH